MKKHLICIEVNKLSGSSVSVLGSENTMIPLWGVSEVFRDLTVKAETFFFPVKTVPISGIYYVVPRK